nr:ABC transporter permease [Chitinophagaceae bacterium]
SQSKALWAITKASFKAIFANPSALFFSVLFPIIFILIFGAFGSSGGVSYRIALTANSDTSSAFYRGLKKSSVIKIVTYTDTADLNEDLIKGNLTAVLDIQSATDSLQKPITKVHVRSTTASSNTLGSFMPMLDYLRLKTESNKPDINLSSIQIEKPEVKAVRKYRQIDFILPGQLGFSVLFSTLFGIAFTFFGLREQLVLKRFYASPVNRINILIGIGASRLFFQLINVIVLIVFGHFVLNFTLVHGFATAIDMLLVTVIMLFQLMGVGLIFSSLSKTDSSLPLLINLYGFPQMMLSGTFFPIDVFPAWLQSICRLLPLTQYNDAMRKLAFEGLSLFQCWREIGMLSIWLVITYIITIKVIRWE